MAWLQGAGALAGGKVGTYVLDPSSIHVWVKFKYTQYTFAFANLPRASESRPLNRTDCWEYCVLLAVPYV